MKKTISLFLTVIFLFVFSLPAFATENEDTDYIIMYTKASYKNTPYEKIFNDHREFLNPDNYGIPVIKDISVIAAYRDDNPHISPPFYVLAIKLTDSNLINASFYAAKIYIKGIADKALAVGKTDYEAFLKNFVPEVTFPESHFALYTPGDIMCYNKVTSASARTVLRISVGLENKENFPWLIGDMNGDGRLTASDARTILRISVGLE